ncbi:protein FAR1-RELATED SEQUENCE 5-like [Quercus lobata]|uniref:protein FAR1-RELATED SEQUENCE 5-like n=1 Tax=Quercus lobata TaxID=97700 RepID=UPI00124819FC|nr:protein FAR1-RELATED SEQUENCE 5-like [Quercus lobata]
MPFGIFVGINNHGKTILFGCALLRNETTSAFQWLMKVDLAIEDIEQTQSHDTMLEKYIGSSLRTLSPIEEQAHSVLTPYAFKIFQEEFGRATQYSVLQENGIEFVLQYYEEKTSQKHLVLWDGEMTSCSCKNFEFWGILCRHTLSVFIHKDCYQIPSLYLPPRWCRETSLGGKELIVLSDENLVDKENMVDANANDAIDGDCFVHCPPLSKTKGRPKQKRMKGGKELGKQKRTCGFCKHVGHNISTCLEKEKEKENSTSSNGAKKMKNCTSIDMGLNPIFYLKC